MLTLILLMLRHKNVNVNTNLDMIVYDFGEPSTFLLICLVGNQSCQFGTWFLLKQQGMNVAHNSNIYSHIQSHIHHKSGTSVQDL